MKLKSRIHITLILLISIHYFAFSQIEIIPKIGISFSKITQDENINNLPVHIIHSDNFDAKKIAFGILTQYHLNRKFILHGEASFIQKGTNIIETQGLNYDWQKVDLKYLNINLQISYETFKGLYLGIGPFYEFLLKQTVVDTSVGLRPKRIYSSKDYGLGISLNWRIENIVTSFEYMHGLDRIRSSKSSQYNRMFRLSIGYAFSFR